MNLLHETVPCEHFFTTSPLIFMQNNAITSPSFSVHLCLVRFILPASKPLSVCFRNVLPCSRVLFLSLVLQQSANRFCPKRLGRVPNERYEAVRFNTFREGILRKWNKTSNAYNFFFFFATARCTRRVINNVTTSFVRQTVPVRLYL